MAQPKRKEQPGMMIYFDQVKSMMKLKPEELKAFLGAMVLYAQKGTPPNFPEDSISDALWPMVEERIDNDKRRYKETAELNSKKRKFGAYKAKREKAGKDSMNFDEWIDSQSDNE